MEKLQEIWDKATDMFFKMTSKFDGISEKINQQFGTNINVGIIIGGAILVVITAFFVKTVLGIKWSMLENRN